MSGGLHYTYRVEWSPEDGEYAGLVAEFPSLSHLDPDPVEAIRGIQELVESVVADMHESHEVPPVPLGDRRYSGKVFVRTSPELHRRLTIEAAEQGVSVNQWAAQKLAERSGGVQYQAVVQAALEAARKVLARESLEEHIGAIAATWRAELPAPGHCLQQTGSPVVQTGLALLDMPWPTYFKPACLECEARRAADADQEDVGKEAGLPA